MSDSRAWPLVFSYRGRVSGREFTATVDLATRVLAEEQELGRVWMNGAKPGGFAAGGDDIPSAYEELKKLLHNILHDIAEEAESFDAFDAAMRSFFGDVDSRVEKKWLARWRANKQGTLDVEPVDWLIRAKGAEARARLEVTEVPASSAKIPPVIKRGGTRSKLVAPSESGVFRIAA